MGSRQPSAISRRVSWRLNVFLALLVAASLLAGPRLMDGLAALEWVRYYAMRGPTPRHSGEQAERAGRFAARAIDRTAPLPTASTAARLALDLGRNIEPRDPAAALILFGHVHEALARVGTSRVRGLGLGALTAEAAELEQRARARVPEGNASTADKPKTP